jgi:hypothetical protein
MKIRKIAVIAITALGLAAGSAAGVMAAAAPATVGASAHVAHGTYHFE